MCSKKTNVIQQPLDIGLYITVNHRVLPEDIPFILLLSACSSGTLIYESRTNSSANIFID